MRQFLGLLIIVLILFGCGVYFFILAYMVFKTGNIVLMFSYVAIGIWMWLPPRLDPIYILLDKIWGKKDG